MRRPPTRRERRDRGPRAVERPGQADPRRRLDAPALEPRVGEDLARRPVERRSAPRRRRRPGSHRPSSRSVLCSTMSSAVPVAASSRSASPTSRVPSGSSWAVGSSRTRCGRSHREQRGDHDELRLTARQPPRLALGEMPRCRAIASAALVRATVSRRRQPQVHRPEGDLLEDRAGDPRQLGGRVLEADPDPRRELVERLAGHRLRRRSRAVPGQPAADRARARGRTRRGRASTCRRRSRRRPRRSRRRRASGRCRARTSLA